MPDDLLDQASYLARFDKGKPKQANLRRAVSSAYYALFHLLVDEACRAWLGTTNDVAPYRFVLGRAFDHGTMKRCCESFSGGTLPQTVSKGVSSNIVIPAEVQEVAKLFVNLQEKRQLADYDRNERFSRADVVGLVAEVRSVCEEFRKVSDGPVKRFFLAGLATWQTLLKRR